MSDSFRIKGRYYIKPSAYATDFSADFEVDAEVDEQLALSKKDAQVIHLAADPIVSVALGDITAVALLIVKVNNPCKLTVTSSVGTSQVIPVDEFLVLVTQTNPITAVSIQRTAGLDTYAKIVLGQL